MDIAVLLFLSISALFFLAITLAAIKDPRKGASETFYVCLALFSGHIAVIVYHLDGAWNVFG